MKNINDEQVLVEGTVEAAEKTVGFFKKAFQDMKESAKAQHEVDKAEFAAAKAEAKANFEENRGHTPLPRQRPMRRRAGMMHI